MGRLPSLTAPDRGRRSARAVAPGSPDSTDSSSVAYPRRFPRLGPGFQTRFPAECGGALITRPPPVPMSADIPYRTVQELQNDTIIQPDIEIDATRERPSRAPAPLGYNPNPSMAYGARSQNPQQRLHGANQDRSFIPYVQGVMESSAVKALQPTQDCCDIEWTHEVVQWHDLQQLRVGHKSRKSRFKRPASSENSALPQFITKKPKLELGVLGEEHILAYQQRHGAATTEQAYWSTLVHLTRGQAASVQRARLRKQYHDRFKQPLRESSESWRQEFMRRTAIRGDYRQESPPTANADNNNSNSTAPSTSYDSALNDAEYAKSVWKAVLACAHSIENMANGDDDDKGAVVTLPSVLDFISRSCDLPSPEDLFRGSDAKHMVEEISKTMWRLLNLVQTSRNAHAKLVDAWHGTGVDVEAMRKIVEATKNASPLLLVEMPELERQIQVISEWQGRLDKVLGIEDLKERDDMETLVALAEEAESHGFVSKGKVMLEARLEKGYILRNRIREWQLACETQKQSVKTVAALVREIQRTKFLFPEASEILEFSAEVDSWTDRASIAIRSRISSGEINELIKKGLAMPLDVSDYLAKLKTRASLANEWIESCESVLPTIKNSAGIADDLQWLRSVRSKLASDGHSEVHDLACSGTRVPVEIEKVKLLQIELDARTWSTKTRGWLPPSASNGGCESSRRGKIEDLQEHMEKAVTLRGRLCLPRRENEAWVLDYEQDLAALVQSAENWYDRYEEYLEGDNRRSGGRKCLSLPKLRQIVQEGTSIYSNFGSVTIKITKILTQAEAWYEKHKPLLDRSKIPPKDMTSETYLNIDELQSAVEEASSDISLDLDEATALDTVLQRIKDWKDRVAAAVGDKRRPGKKVTFTVGSLEKLMEQAALLPTDTDDDVNRLRELLASVKEWQSQSSLELTKIADGFDHLREAITETYNAPSEFVRDTSDSPKAASPTIEAVVSDDMDMENDDQVDSMKDDAMSVSAEEKKCPIDNASNCGTVSTSSSDQDHNATTHLGNGDCTVHSMIKALVRDSKHSCIITPEGETVARLETVWRWCVRSLKYLVNHRDVFDKRFFGAFDRFIKEGKDLVKACTIQSNAALTSSWTNVVEDQLLRLGVLHTERDKFSVWSKKVEQFLSSQEKRIPLEKVKELEVESRDFPDGGELVSKIRVLVTKVDTWVAKTNEALSASERMSLPEAKALLDAGQKLGVQCPELRDLRNGLKEARSWAARIKRSKVDQGEADSATVKTLHDEHKDLIVSMPDELSKLRHAMRSYCLCRRPYEGFMIGCDGCEEWFHGACIGVTEAKADKVSKYLCIRCSLKKGFYSSATNVVGVIRKWNNPADLCKSRQIGNQKHQRKARKDFKDMEKLEKQRTELQSQLDALESNEALGGSAGVVTPVDTIRHDVSASAPNERLDLAPLMVEPTQGSLSFQGAPTEPSSGKHTAESAVNASERSLQSSGPPTLPQPQSVQSDAVTSTTGVSNAEVGGEVPPGQSVQLATMQTSGNEKPASLPIIVNAASAGNDQPNANSEDDKSSVPSTIDHKSCNPSNPNPDKVASATAGCPVMSKEDLTKAIAKVTRAVSNCKSRLSKLDAADIERKKERVCEDLRSTDLAIWSLRVKNLVMIPMLSECALKSRPSLDGQISVPMKEILAEAESHGLGELEDVKALRNEFMCLGWYILALTKLARQPTLAEMKQLIKKGSTLSLPEEKAFRMMKVLVNRAIAWEHRVQTAISPRLGEPKAYSVKALQDLSSSGEDIPIAMPMESRLLTVIEDEGNRHCLCCGPSDGRFMLSCDKCKRWFHGTCVEVSKEVGETLDTWNCPRCCGRYIDVHAKLAQFHYSYDVSDDASIDEDDVNPCAPKIDDIWPPFGLKGSEKAAIALGEVVSKIPDERGTWGLSESAAQAKSQEPAPAVEKPVEPKRFSSHFKQPSTHVVSEKPKKTPIAPKPAPAAPLSPKVQQPFMMAPMAIPMLFTAMQSGHLSFGNMVAMHGSTQVNATEDAGVGQPARQVKPNTTAAKEEVSDRSTEQKQEPKTTSTALNNIVLGNSAQPAVKSISRDNETSSRAPADTSEPMDIDSKAPSLVLANQSETLNPEVKPAVGAALNEHVLLVAGDKGGQI